MTGKPKRFSTDYGKQLLLDGYGADADKLMDVQLLYRTLNSLPQIIGMTKVGDPQIIKFKKKPIAGISGFIFIVESHISVHTYRDQRFISVDIYSCKQFDSRKALKFLRETYSIKKLESQIIRRGRHFRARNSE